MIANIRPCRPEDAEALVALVRELARFENLEQFARATPAMLREHLFGPRPVAEAIVAEVKDEVVGFAIYFPTFSTFRGQPGLYLEDVFVREAFRGRGIGKALLAAVARIGAERGIGRLEWSVLDWNMSAIGFYRSLGAKPLEEWTIYRIDEQALARLAAQAPPSSRGTTDA